jgi:hypothetical protein
MWQKKSPGVICRSRTTPAQRGLSIHRQWERAYKRCSVFRAGYARLHGGIPTSGRVEGRKRDPLGSDPRWHARAGVRRAMAGSTVAPASGHLLRVSPAPAPRSGAHPASEAGILPLNYAPADWRFPSVTIGALQCFKPALSPDQLEKHAMVGAAGVEPAPAKRGI